MTTYQVPCQYCGKLQLFERAKPLDDPGALPAFCSTECSKALILAQWQPLVDAGMGHVVEVSCGCLALVMGTEGHGQSMPWLLCERARDQTKPLDAAPFELWRIHSAEVHKAAMDIALDDVL